MPENWWTCHASFCHGFRCGSSEHHRIPVWIQPSPLDSHCDYVGDGGDTELLDSWEIETHYKSDSQRACNSLSGCSRVQCWISCTSLRNLECLRSIFKFVVYFPFSAVSSHFWRMQCPRFSSGTSQVSLFLFHRRSREREDTVKVV